MIKKRIKKIRKENEVEIDFVDDLELEEEIQEVDENTFRDIYIDDVIDDKILKFTKDIINWNREDELNEISIEDRMPIKIHINTNGGAVDPMLILVNVIQASKTPVYTIIQKAYSSGIILSQAGHKRFAYPYSKALIHSGSIAMEEKLHDLGNQVKNIEKQEQQVKELMVNRSKISEKLYKKNYNKEWYLYTDDMIEHGLIDEVITDLFSIF